MTSDGSMARKSWFSLVKKFFISDTDINQHKKRRRQRWFFGRCKIRRVPSIPVSSPTTDAEEHSNQYSNVDILKAPAADEIAAEIFNLPSTTSQYTSDREDESREFSSINFQYNAPTSALNWRREIQEVAATIIQKAFRGYLARKVFWALKGIVRLQATIRGILVRKQAITTLSRLQSIVNIHSQVRAKRIQMLDGSSSLQENKEVMDLECKDIKIGLNSPRRWDESLLTKEEKNDLCSSKKLAAIKRERIKEYSLSNRRSAELEQNKLNGRWTYWLDQWVDTRISKTENLQNLVLVSSTRKRIKDNEPGVKLFKSRNVRKQCHYAESEFPETRSFYHRKQHSIGNRYSAGGGSPVIPTYMAATESAKAKVRSMSSPRLRPLSFDSSSEKVSPYKHKLSPMSSIKSEVTTISMLTRFSNGYSQRSPCLEGPTKSNRNSKYPSVL